MANVIKHKRGSGSDPGASDLVVGEVAIRTDVGKLFTKMDNGSVAEIAGGGSDIAINTLSSSSATGGGSATFNGSAYRFTLSQPPSVSAQQLLVSINGVIQKPVAGTGQPSEGFSVDGTDIILGDAPATGADFFILTFKSLGVSEPADDSVTSAKIVDGAIVNADINASAAIAGSKISPNFGSQNIATTGTLASSHITIANSSPRINLTDTDQDSDFRILVNDGKLKVQDTTNGNANRLLIASDGTVDITGNLDVGAGIDVTGSITASSTGNVGLVLDAGTGSQAGNQVSFIDFKLDGTLKGNIAINETTSGNPLEINSAGTGATEIYHASSKKFETTSTGINVTGNQIITNGNLTVNNGTNSQVYLQASDGSIELTRNSGGAYIDFKNDSTEDNDARIQEASGGFHFSGSSQIGTSLTVLADLTLGGELNMTNDGNKHRFFDNSLADGEALHIRSTQGGDQNHENMAQFIRNAGINLYYDNFLKFSTISTGARIENTGTGNSLGTTAGSASDLLQLHQSDASNVTTYDFMNYRFANGSTHSTSEMRFRRHVDVTDQGYFGLRDSAVTFGYGNSEFMRIASTGAVGIGTTSPGYKLHVNGGAVDLTARFDNTKTGNGDINYIGVGLNSGTTGVALFGHTGHSTAGSQAAWMGCAGDDVAGGTGVKAFRGGTIFMANTLNIGSNSPNVTGARIAATGVQFGAFLETQANTAANGIPLIVNRQADNGIMIEFKQANGVVATIHRNSSNQMVYGGTSDYRLKENNVAISDSLTKIKSLKPYEFNWKELPDTKVLGFFAHELQEVVPQAVTGTKDEMYAHDDTKPKYQNVDNAHIVPLLVAAVKELTAKVEALEAK